MRLGIVGTGSYVPEKVLTNFDLEKILDTSDEWIYTRTGIKERRIAEPGVGVSELCKVACERAMAAAGVGPSDIDLIVLGTITPDTHCPAGANWLEAKLGCDNAVSFMSPPPAQALSFRSHVASALIKAGMNRTALVCAGEIMSRTVNWKERESCILWGDGAGAVVVTETRRAQRYYRHTFTRMGRTGVNCLCPAVAPSRRRSLMRAWTRDSISSR